MDNGGDGLMNSWEIAQGIDPEISSGEDGANGNPDGDSFTNLEEYQYDLTARSYETRVDGMQIQFSHSKNTEGWITGNLNGQFGWLATDSAMLQETTIFTIEGDTGVEILPISASRMQRCKY